MAAGATLLEALTDLAGQQLLVSVRDRHGGVHDGVLAAVGTDVVLVRTSAGPVHVAASHITEVLLGER